VPLLALSSSALLSPCLAAILRSNDALLVELVSSNLRKSATICGKVFFVMLLERSFRALKISCRALFQERRCGWRLALPLADILRAFSP
jgi:hypothetical protein